MNKDLKLIINLHRSPLLADAVGMVLDKYSDHKEGSNFFKPSQICGYASKYSTEGGGVQFDGRTTLHAAMSYYREKPEFSSYTFIDAATEFGKLVALLEKPEPKVIKDLAHDNGNVRGNVRDGEVKEDGSGIVVGCSFVPRAKVKEAYEALFEEGK